MAITYVVGIPRSGKSYYVVYQLWKSFVFQPKDTFLTKLVSKFIKPKIPRHYNYAYTNINQFDFSKSPKFRKLDFDDLKIKLTELYNMYQDKKTDDELIEKAKEFDIYNVLFCIDEVHNFLGDKPDPVLVWWVTYHGHLYQDMILITQDLSLVNSKYKSNAEFFYKAVPPSKRLFTSKFRYTQYGNSRMAMNGKVGDFTIPALPDVFKMYVSGAENKSKSFVKKYLVIGFILFLFLAVMFYFFISTFKSDVKKTPKKHINKSSVIVPVSDKNISDTVPTSVSVQSVSKVSKDTKKDPITLFEINCIKNICTYKNVDMPKLLLQKVINDNKANYYIVDNNSFSKYFVLVKKSAFDFLQIGGKENEKKKKSTAKNKSGNFNLLSSITRR